MVMIEAVKHRLLLLVHMQVVLGVLLLRHGEGRAHLLPQGLLQHSLLVLLLRLRRVVEASRGKGFRSSHIILLLSLLVFPAFLEFIVQDHD